MDYNDIVLVKTGPAKGRIGIIDDDGDGPNELVVYFGHPRLCGFYYSINAKRLRKALVEDLIKRVEIIDSKLCAFTGPKLSWEKKYKLLLERSLIANELAEGIIENKYPNNHTSSLEGTKVFISHSSKDKPVARQFYTDLKKFDCDPWLDEWKIKLGDSIPLKLGMGIEEAEFVLILLSKDSIKSHWVEKEWATKYMDEIRHQKTMLIPILLDECEVPTMLKDKKYADLSKGYQETFTEILDTMSDKKEPQS